MKKKLVGVLLLCLVVIFSMVGCTPAQGENVEVDYSGYEFADVAWTRDAECDIESLRLTSDGEFHYSCSCGNPVNDADAVESYTYDDATKTFTLHCIEELEGMVTEIVLVSCDGKTLVLDFDGEERVFVVAEGK